ncbi:5593_t:CDS:2, partial [Funneliformis geosporum]
RNNNLSQDIPRVTCPTFAFNDSDWSDSDDEEDPIYKPFRPLEEGIKARNEEKYEIAWDCFDVDETIKLYKEAADTEASFQYAMCILQHHGNDFKMQDYEKYLRIVNI